MHKIIPCSKPTTKRWDSAELLELEKILQFKVPYAHLSLQKIPLENSIELALIEDSYPQENLRAEQIAFLMDSPPYWAFCWASGQVMARFLLDHPEQVYGKNIVDFGSGSGVVAIAAKMAGAKQVVAVDNDPAALIATSVNATLNKMEVSCVSCLDNLPFDQREAIILIADVFYDAENIPLLKSFLANFLEVIIADSRVKPTDLSGVKMAGSYDSCTVPDLGESTDFNNVNIYR